MSLDPAEMLRQCPSRGPLPPGPRKAADTTSIALCEPLPAWFRRAEYLNWMPVVNKNLWIHLAPVWTIDKVRVKAAEYAALHKGAVIGAVAE
jgi:hypothetical protein